MPYINWNYHFNVIEETIFIVNFMNLRYRWYKIRHRHFSETPRTCFPARSVGRWFIYCSESFDLSGLQISCTPPSEKSGNSLFYPQIPLLPRLALLVFIMWSFWHRSKWLRNQLEAFWFVKFHQLFVWK